MACDLTTIQSAACVSGIGREQNQIKLLQLIAQLTCEAAEASGPTAPGGSDGQVQFNNAGAFGGDAGLTYDDATNALTVGTSVTVPLLASPAATALSFASAGTTRANFSTVGDLLFNTDNTNDIGASGATRPRRGYFGTEVVSPLFTGALTGAASLNLLLTGGTLTGALLFSPTNTYDIGFSLGTKPRDGYFAGVLSAARLAMAGGANITVGSFTGYSVTGAGITTGIALSGTWNTTGAPTAVDVNITDTASNAASKLLDLRTGSTSRFSVDRLGNLSLPGGVLLTTKTALTNGAAAALGTLANAPVAGNPTKWVPVNDNGTTRYIPMW